MKFDGLDEYEAKDRIEGAGPLRTGESLPLNYDLYTMLFVSVLHHESVYDKWRARKGNQASSSDSAPKAQEEEKNTGVKRCPQGSL